MKLNENLIGDGTFFAGRELCWEELIILFKKYWKSGFVFSYSDFLFPFCVCGHMRAKRFRKIEQ